MRILKLIKVLNYFLFSLISILICILTVFLIRKYTLDAYENTRNYFTYESGNRETVEIVVPEDGDVKEVAKQLKEKGLITSELIFRVETMVERSGDFVGGTYVIEPGSGIDEIRVLLSQPPIIPADEITVVLREGLNIQEIGEVLEHNGIITKQDFIDACNNETFNYAFLNSVPERDNPLEGYLFPDTYFFVEGMTGRQVITKMLDRFEQVYANYSTRAYELGLTTDEVITIASIIEKEIRVPEERELAAAVIYNRLDQNINLGMCSTILYVLGVRKDRLMDEDLKVESPYNTYQNPGLPVGPIASPGEACIRAALYPAAVDYLYFVVRNEETGEHAFSNNYDQFLRDKEVYNQRF